FASATSWPTRHQKAPDQCTRSTRRCAKRWHHRIRQLKTFASPIIRFEFLIRIKRRKRQHASLSRRPAATNAGARSDAPPTSSTPATRRWLTVWNFICFDRKNNVRRWWHEQAGGKHGQKRNRQETNAG